MKKVVLDLGDGEVLRLDEFTKDEWRDVCMTARPDLTEEEFDQLWEEFQAAVNVRRECAGEA